MGVVDFLYDTGRQITGNIPKAILCVPDKSKIDIGMENGSAVEMMLRSDDLRREFDKLSGTGSSAVQTFRKLTSGDTKTMLADRKYLALEVPYNPSSIYLETVAGMQTHFQGASMGDASNNMLRQNVEPTSTTLSVQLLFDAVNAQDAFMVSNTALTAGNAFTAVRDVVHGSYSVKAEMDGILALLIRPALRRVLFFWANMCFQGELTSVSSDYLMFNTKGNPVRGQIQLTIRQEESPHARYENTYWQNAFDKAFGDEITSKTTKATSTLSKIASNSVLNLNI